MRGPVGQLLLECFGHVLAKGLHYPWDVVPYANFDLTLPQFHNSSVIKAVAYDPVDQRLYMASQYGDYDGKYYNAPIIHVYSLTGLTTR